MVLDQVAVNVGGFRELAAILIDLSQMTFCLCLMKTITLLQHLAVQRDIMVFGWQRETFDARCQVGNDFIVGQCFEAQNASCAFCFIKIELTEE